MKYLTVEQVLRIHARAISQSWGDAGVRDLGLVESAVAQPRASFRGKQLYPTLAEKAAALAFSLVMNHPFADGNKRTGYGAMIMFLSRNGRTIAAPLDDHASVFLRLAAGALDREGFRAWVSAWITAK
ncbi:MAG: type II toxin-antitoxin system death-on-curing family toxin [Isosphaeraceae bacterium]